MGIFSFISGICYTFMHMTEITQPDIIAGLSSSEVVTRLAKYGENTIYHRKRLRPIIAFIKKYSLIPLMGLITCLYLLTGMTKSNWAWFIGWLAIGLVIYFLYGYRKSKLSSQ